MSVADCVTATTSSALSAGKGLASGPVLTMMASPTRTSKQPLRGLSRPLTVTVASGPSASSSPRAILVARVLNTDHDRHASISIGGYVPGASSNSVNAIGAIVLIVLVESETGGDAEPVATLVTSRSISSALRPDTGRPAARSLSFRSTTVNFVRSSVIVARTTSSAIG